MKIRQWVIISLHRYLRRKMIAWSNYPSLGRASDSLHEVQYGIMNLQMHVLVTDKVSLMRLISP
jgi:hypothetical protein